MKDLRRVAFSAATKACKLWSRSHEELEERYQGGPTVDDLEARQTGRGKCEDATPAETKYWGCLQEDLEGSRVTEQLANNFR